jgi:enoyl-CoA hydratase/carnithine racemase
VKRGLAPAYISTFIVPQIGPFLARDLMLTGRKITATEAKLLNIVTKVSKTDEELTLDIQAMINELLEGGPIIQQKIKELVQVVSTKSEQESKEHVKNLFQYMIRSPEAQNGMKAFMEKRKPDWNQSKL